MPIPEDISFKQEQYGSLTNFEEEKPPVQEPTPVPQIVVDPTLKRYTRLLKLMNLIKFST